MLQDTNFKQLDIFQNISYHMIPENHILKRINSQIDLSFVNDLVKDKYCAAFGRPAWNPETIARICILQMLYDLSDEAIIDEICVNRAAEYFCGLSPVDKRPHPTTLCKFRQLRLDDSIMDDIMAEMVRQMIEKGIIKKESGIIIDSTHITANTKRKVPERLMKQLAKNIFKESIKKEGLTEAEVEEAMAEKEAALPDWEKTDDHQEAKKEMKAALESVIEEADPNLESVIEAKEILNSDLFIEQKGIRSLEDKDARVGRKDTTTSFFGYKTEYIMSEEGIIMTIRTHPGNYRDGDAFIEMLGIVKGSGFAPTAAYGDKAYCRSDILNRLNRDQVDAIIPISHAAYRIDEELFKYNKDSDTWTCIKGNESTTGQSKVLRGESKIRYSFDKEQCRHCPNRAQCIGKSNRIGRVLDIGKNTLGLYEHSQFTKSKDFLERYKTRARIEPKNAEMKRFHGLGRARGFGLKSMRIQAVFTAIAVNLKRMAAII